jgi:hypothetical protein
MLEELFSEAKLTPQTQTSTSTQSRHNGDATTSYQIDSGTPVVGDAGAEPYNFGTFFSDLAAGSNLTGSMGRFLLFDEELSDAEVAFIQTLLLPN